VLAAKGKTPATTTENERCSARSDPTSPTRWDGEQAQSLLQAGEPKASNNFVTAFTTYPAPAVIREITAISLDGAGQETPQRSTELAHIYIYIYFICFVPEASKL